MRSTQISAFLVFALAGLLASCSLVADFGQYRARDAAPDAADTLCGGATCGSTEACCGDVCTELGTLSDCGACGDSCDEGVNSDPVCMGGACDVMCDVGFGNCDGMASNGCEQALNDGDHCGGCGMPCGPTDVCATVSGVTSCRSTCPAGEEACGRGCFDLDSSILHCGECGLRCRIPVGGGLPMCVEGECEDGCEAGMGNCDGNDGNGCEAALVTRYDDFDEDDFGDPAGGFLTCPGEPFTSDNADDCDDTMAAVNPDAAEVCDGVDNNCSDTIDDVPGVGEACACDDGAVPGALECTSTGPAPVCNYPSSETCNGVDDDCNSMVDEGFFCRLGETQTCTLGPTGGCTPIGQQTCMTGCGGFGSCVATDLCNRTDDDCDNKVDEDALVVPAPPRSLALGTNIDGLRAHLNTDSGQVGLIFVSGASGADLYFASLNPDGTIALSPTLVVSNVSVTSRGAGDITWVGTHWLVGYVQTLPSPVTARVRAIAADGSLGAFESLERDSSANPTGVRLDRIGTSNQALVAWTSGEAFGGRSEVRDAVATVSVTGELSVVEEILDSSGPARRFLDVDVISTSSGALMAYVITEGSTEGDVFVASSTGGLVGGGANMLTLDGRIERELELARDPVSGRIGMVYAAGPPGSPTGFIGLAVFVPTSTTPTTLDLDLVPSGRQRWHIAAANDGGFGVVYTTGSGPNFDRFDANGASMWTRHSPAVGVDMFAVGLPTGDVHYLLFGGAAAGAVVQPVQCL